MENNNEQKILSIFNRYGFNKGRLISISKSKYREAYPDNLVYFNANILTKTYGKIWYGDLDITRDRPNLQNISREINEELYILKESDCRFENETSSVDELVKKAMLAIRG